MALINQKYFDAVVAIGAKKDDWYGTGFFIGISAEKFTGNPEGSFIGTPHENKYIVFLVTNKHIIERQIDDEEKEILIKCNSKISGTAKEKVLDLYDNKGDPLFVFHTNPNIDLAILYVDNYNELIEELEIKFFMDKMLLKIDEMEIKGVSEGDFVYILGFPMGNVGINQTAVIVRSGSIARIHDVFEGYSKEFLLDAFIFPGNSGGHVFIKPEYAKIKGTSSAEASYLIGVVKSYLTYEDVAYSEQTGHMRAVFSENSGLALVHPMDYVFEVINIFKRKCGL